MTEEARKPKFEKVTFEQAEEGWKQAAAAADEREPEAVDWKRVDKKKAWSIEEDDFSKYVGETFEIDHDGRKLELELAKVVHLGEPIDLGAEAGTRTQFSLVFEQSELLPEGTYRVRHEKLGELDLYLQPVEPAGEENAPVPHLEAVFN